VRAVVVVAALVLATAGGAAAQAPARAPEVWAFRRPIALPTLAQPGFVELVIDADVYREAALTLQDLRVRELDGVDVAYVVRRHERRAAEATRETRLHDLVTTPERAVRFVLEAGSGRILHNRVRLAIADEAKNFRVPVRVETADEAGRWQVAREAGFIYRVEGDTRAADTSVSYPTSTARRLRVTVGAADGRPLPVTSARLVVATVAERREEAVPATLVAREEDTARRATRLVLDLGGRRPVDRVELDVSDRNFHRVVLIEASDDRTQWRWLRSCPISGVDTGRVRERLTDTHLPETTARYIRVSIDNLDDRPLAITAVRLFAVLRTLVFTAVPTHRYVLEYGNPSAAMPRYDLARTIAYLGDDRLPAATLGPLERVPAPARRTSAWLESQPVLMWVAMAMAMLALGGLLWRMARGVRYTQEDS
jgi:hypothetical protein